MHFIKLLSWLPFVLFIVALPKIGEAQNRQLEAFISTIPMKEDTIKAVFEKITSKIHYDVRLAYSNVKLGNKQEIIDYVLKYNKGLCEHYSQLFKAVLESLGYEVYAISGYTLQEGILDTVSGHSWNAVKLGSEWYLYDLTWAAGYVENKKFYKKYDPKWYKVSPEQFKKSHFPFDPVWQLIPHPISHKDIKNQNYNSIAGPTMHFDSIIASRNELTRFQVLSEEINRTSSMGLSSQLIRDRVGYLNSLMNMEIQNDVIDQMNDCISIFNEVITDFNIYFSQKNSFLRSRSKTDTDFMDIPIQLKAKVEKANSILGNLSTDDNQLKRDLNSNQKEAQKLLTRIDQEVKYVQDQRAK